MKTILTILALAALTFTAHAQTNRGLFYNTTNFTVLGWTNTNALVFTNPVSVLDVQITPDGLSYAGVTTIDLGTQELVSGTNGVVMNWSGGSVLFPIAPNFLDSGVQSTTRSNLFGSVGISTNIQFVRVGGTTNTLVFSNGILHSVTTP